MRLAASLLPVLLLVTSAAHAEVEGEDHPLLPRYAGAKIRSYRGPSTDEIVIPTGPVANAKTTANARLLKGEVTHIDYAVTPAAATLQIAEYYQSALQAEGFRTVFSCARLRACGEGMGELILNSGEVAPAGFADGLFGDRMRVIVAQRGNTYALLHIYEGPDRSVIYEAVIDAGTGRQSGDAAKNVPTGLGTAPDYNYGRA